MKQYYKEMATGGGAVVIGFTLAVSSVCTSCKKGFLDAKPKQSIITLTEIKNIQAILDRATMSSGYPVLGEAGADNYYITSNEFILAEKKDQNIYTWASVPDFYQSNSVLDWKDCYEQVFYANTALEQINKITPSNSDYPDWANVKGSALFHRAYSYYSIAQVFCKPYIPASASDDLGVILRLEADINLPSVRVSVQETYDQIINDLLEAVDLLPGSPLFQTRPSKPAAYAMLARVYLTMQKYDEAFTYSDLCLQNFNTLIDYKTLDTSLSYPFPAYPNNPEIIFRANNLGSRLLPFATYRGTVDSVLFGKYSDNDLRKKLFFSNDSKILFKGTYLGSPTYNIFGGPATDEILLIRAECNARKSNKTAAMADLNSLLEKRFKSGFAPFTATDADDALRQILEERRKELCFRGIRWTDLRRLNQDDRFKDTLYRIVNGQTYILPPKDNRYVYPIPDNEILLSGVAQNPR